MSDELDALRRVKKLAAQLVAIDAEKDRLAMEGRIRDIGPAQARFFETWNDLKKELAA